MNLIGWKRAGRALLVVALTAVGWGLPSLAALGKGSELAPEDRFVAPGEHVVLRTVFYRGAYEGRPRHGPYQVYLLPGTNYLEADRPVPPDALRVGQLAVTRRSSVSWIARVAFTVPHLPVGLYTIDYCNDPCTVQGMGDLSGGSLWVVNTEDEARLAARVERLDNLVRDLRFRANRARGLKARLTEERTARRMLEARIDALEARLHEFASASKPNLEGSGASGDSGRPWIAVVPIAAGVVAAGLFVVLRKWRLRRWI